MLFILISNVTVVASQNIWQPHSFKSTISRPPCTICGRLVAEDLRFSEGDFCSFECMISLKKEPTWLSDDFNDEWFKAQPEIESKQPQELR